MKRAAKSIDITESDGESYDSDEEGIVRAIEGDKQSKEDTPTDDAKKEGEAEIPIELQKKKKTRTGRPFTEADVVGPGGISYIYKTFPRVFHSKGPGYEAHDLSRLVGMYKEWAFRLYPGLAFPDLIAKVDQLGSKGVVRCEIDRLREDERNRYLEAQGVNVRELLEKKRAEDARRLAEEQRLEKLAKRRDDDSFIASDSDSESDSGSFKPDKEKSKGDKKKKLKKNKHNNDGEAAGAIHAKGLAATGGTELTQEQLDKEEEEEEAASDSSSDEDSLVVGDDSDNDVAASKKPVKVTKTYGRKTETEALPVAASLADEEEAETGAQENYDFLDTLDFLE